MIRVKYTHGKPLRGLATVKVTEYDPYELYRSHRLSKKIKLKDKVVARRTFNIDGEETIEFDIKNELKFDPTKDDRLDVKNYKIKVDVTEALTGLVQSTDAEVKVYRNTYEISTDLQTYGPLRGIPCNLNVCIEFLYPISKRTNTIRFNKKCFFV